VSLRDRRIVSAIRLCNFENWLPLFFASTQCNFARHPIGGCGATRLPADLVIVKSTRNGRGVLFRFSKWNSIKEVPERNGNKAPNNAAPGPQHMTTDRL
jgi:hypothetical protein